MKIQSVCTPGSLCSVVAAASNSSSASLPVVDLGYERQRATTFNKTGGYYSFNNIRYAAPPTGQNRFRAPQPPTMNRSTVQTGEQRRMCAQASPAWTNIPMEYIPKYLNGQKTFNTSSFNLTSGGLPPADPNTTEDCLFLDVAVPQKIFEKAGKGWGAPVLVWIYGGG